MKRLDLKGLEAAAREYCQPSTDSYCQVPVQVSFQHKPYRSLLDSVFTGVFVAVFEDAGPEFLLSNFDDISFTPGEKRTLASKMFVRLLAACSNPPLGIHGPVSVPDRENLLEMVSYTFKVSSHGSSDPRVLEAGYRPAVIYILFKSPFKGFVYDFIPSIGIAIRRILEHVNPLGREYLLAHELEEALPYIMDLPRELSDQYRSHVIKNVHRLLRKSKMAFAEITGRGPPVIDRRLELLYAFIEAGLPSVTTVLLSLENGLKAVNPFSRYSTSDDRADQLITTLTGHITASHNVNEAAINLFRLQAEGHPPGQILDSLISGKLRSSWKPLENTILYSGDHVLFFTPVTVNWHGEKRRLTCCTQHQRCEIDIAFRAHFAITKAVKNIFKPVN
ncbi:MAG: hypothetical protein ACTSP4_13325 [Candidatus Hodarchaeales archaeon]